MSGVFRRLRLPTRRRAGRGPASAGDLRQRRLDLRAGYGFAMFGGGFTGTPEIGFGLSEFELRVEGSRLVPANDDRAPEDRIGLRMSARW